MTLHIRYNIITSGWLYSLPKLRKVTEVSFGKNLSEPEFSSRATVHCTQWRKPGAEFGGTEKIFADQDEVFFSKNVHFSGKNF